MIGQQSLLGPDTPPRHSAKRRRVKTVIQEIMTLATHCVRHARQQILSFPAHTRPLLLLSASMRPGRHPETKHSFLTPVFSNPPATDVRRTITFPLKNPFKIPTKTITKGALPSFPFIEITYFRPHGPHRPFDGRLVTRPRIQDRYVLSFLAGPRTDHSFLSIHYSMDTDTEPLK